MKNNRSNKLGRFIGPATLALGLLVGNAVMGQTPVTMTRNATVIDFGGTDAWSIRQYATEDAGTDIRFDFQRIVTGHLKTYHVWSPQNVPLYGLSFG
jgi:hypothetical protein